MRLREKGKTTREDLKSIRKPHSVSNRHKKPDLAGATEEDELTYRNY